MAAAGPRLPSAGQAQHTQPPGATAARVATAGPRLPFVWQAQYTELPGGAAVRVAATGPRLLSRGRGSTHSLLEQLRRAWPPLGRGCLSYHSSQLILSHHNFSSHFITTYHIDPGKPAAEVSQK